MIFLLLVTVSSYAQDNGVVSTKTPNALSTLDVFETVHKAVFHDIRCNGRDPSSRRFEYSAAVEGARKVLATFYQSCTALTQVLDINSTPLRGVNRAKTRYAGNKQRKIYNRDQFIDSHIVLSEIKRNEEHPNPYCINTLESLPVYGFGSKPNANRVEGIDNLMIDLFSRGNGVSKRSLSAHSIDCSGFIATALAISGLKLKSSYDVNANTRFDSIGTSTFDEISRSKNSCLDQAVFDSTDSLLKGDIVNVGRNHVIMIDSIGLNPLGIDGKKTKKECNSIGVDDFNFTYIHSGNINNSYGPSRVHSSHHIKEKGTMFKQLEIVAVQACLDRINGKADRKIRRSAGKGRKFSILRHRSSDPNCIESNPPDLIGKDCVSGCFPGEVQI